MTSTTLQTLWRMVANELGAHQAATVTTAAVGPDPGRWLISTALRSDGGDPQHIGHFVQMNTGATGNVRVAYHEPSLGAIAVDQTLSTIAIVTTSQFEVTWPLPIAFTDGIVGIITMLQEAMRDIWYEDTLDLTPTAGEYIVDLSAQANWLDSETRVQRLPNGSPVYLDPPLQTGYPQQLASWRYGELNFQTGTPTLRLKRAYLETVSVGSTAQLGIIRPVYSLVNGDEYAIGPTASTDTVGGDPVEIVAVTKLRAYKYLATAQHLSDAERQRYAAMIDPQEAWVRANVRHYLPRDEMPQQQAPSGRAA